MTPDERDAAFDDRIVHDLDELRPEFRRQTVAEAQRVGEEFRRTERACPVGRITESFSERLNTPSLAETNW